MYEEGNLEGAEDWMFEDVQFHLVASPQLNAYTTGGKHIYLYTGLFEKSDTEDAFAAVVGHEFGHIVGKHVQEAMTNQQLMMAGAAGVGLLAAAVSEDGQRTQNATTFGGLAMAGGQIVGLSFGRENEREADELGFQFYVRAGYDPDKFADFFKTMIEEGAGGPGGIQAFLSSHPKLEERVEAAERRAANVDRSMVQQFQAPPLADGRQLASLHAQAQPFTQKAAVAMRSREDNAFTRGLALLSAFPACVGGLADGIPPEEQANNPVGPR